MNPVVIDLIKWVVAFLIGSFTILKAWKEYIKGEVEKAKERSVGAAKMAEQDKEIAELKKDYRETLEILLKSRN